jgi:hypothetical protein
VSQAFLNLCVNAALIALVLIVLAIILKLDE